jgi:hypothetical protein
MRSLEILKTQDLFLISRPFCIRKISFKQIEIGKSRDFKISKLNLEIKSRDLGIKYHKNLYYVAQMMNNKRTKLNFKFILIFVDFDLKK